MEDAWALKGEEGRDKLRKAAVRSKYPLTRRCPNGATQSRKEITLPRSEQTRGTETSHYPQEKKIRMIPSVVASESGAAQTRYVSACRGL